MHPPCRFLQTARNKNTVRMYVVILFLIVKNILKELVMLLNCKAIYGGFILNCGVHCNIQ